MSFYQRLGLSLFLIGLFGLATTDKMWFAFSVLALGLVLFLFEAKKK